MALIDSVKLALRISTSALDTEIDENIAAAKDEMIRAGVSAGYVDGEWPLIVNAVKTYVLSRMAPDMDLAEGYRKSFEYQLENLRKSTLESEG